MKTATFAERLAEAMRVREVSQTELHNRTGINKSSISTYLKGTYEAKQDKVYKMARALNVSPAWLMGYDGSVAEEEKNTRLVEMGKRIRDARLEKEMSQEALAHICGYHSRSSINKIEAGLNDIPQSKIKSIADALSVSPAWLMGCDGTEGKTAHPVSAENDDETAALRKYRRLSPEGRQYIQDQLDFRLGLEAKKTGRS